MSIKVLNPVFCLYVQKQNPNVVLSPLACPKIWLFWYSFPWLLRKTCWSPRMLLRLRILVLPVRSVHNHATLSMFPLVSFPLVFFHTKSLWLRFLCLLYVIHVVTLLIGSLQEANSCRGASKSFLPGNMKYKWKSLACHQLNTLFHPHWFNFISI